MKRRHFLQKLSLTTLFAFITSVSARVLEPFELTIAKGRKRVDKRWMHMDKSFDYFDYDFADDMGFGLLRVLDDFELDFLSGTPVHPHKNIEILTILLEGQIFHQDSLGHAGLLREGDYQMMSAGKGLKHAETNPSQFNKTKGLQIWISSLNETGESMYQQKDKDEVDLYNRMAIIASNQISEGMLTQQDAQVLRGQFDEKKSLQYKLINPKNVAYCFVIEGSVKIFDKLLYKRDGLGVSQKEIIEFEVYKDSDFLLIEIPKEGTF